MMNMSADSLELPPIEHARKIDGVRELRQFMITRHGGFFVWRWDTVIDGEQVHYQMNEGPENYCKDCLEFSEKNRPIAIQKIKEYVKNERI